MKCTICGADNLEGAAYCEDCGSKLPRSSPESASAKGSSEEEAVPEAMEVSGGHILCPACGSENPEGAKFCDDCGTGLESAIPAPPGESGDLIEPPVGMAKLVVEGVNKEFYLDKDVVTIGRQSPADWIFPDIDLTDFDEEAYISRRHARILKKDNGFIFEDMGSSNGSYINNVRISQGVQQFLNVGDVVRLGKTVLTLVKE